jgi:hypothetical protein
MSWPLAAERQRWEAYETARASSMQKNCSNPRCTLSLVFRIWQSLQQASHNVISVTSSMQARTVTTLDLDGTRDGVNLQNRGIIFFLYRYNIIIILKIKYISIIFYNESIIFYVYFW